MIPIKFTALGLMAILSALPAVDACDLRLQWLTNWNEAGLRRYRVQLITTPRNDDHLTTYSNGIWSCRFASNPQTFWDGDKFVVDISFPEGGDGHYYYRICHEQAANLYRSRTGCSASLDI